MASPIHRHEKCSFLDAVILTYEYIINNGFFYEVFTARQRTKFSPCIPNLLFELIAYYIIRNSFIFTKWRERTSHDHHLNTFYYVAPLQDIFLWDARSIHYFHNAALDIAKKPHNFLIANPHSAVITFIIGHVSYILCKRSIDNGTRFERKLRV